MADSMSDRLWGTVVTPRINRIVRDVPPAPNLPERVGLRGDTFAVPDLQSRTVLWAVEGHEAVTSPSVDRFRREFPAAWTAHCETIRANTPLMEAQRDAADAVAATIMADERLTGTPVTVRGQWDTYDSKFYAGIYVAQTPETTNVMSPTFDVVVDANLETTITTPDGQPINVDDASHDVLEYLGWGEVDDVAEVDEEAALDRIRVIAAIAQVPVDTTPHPSQEQPRVPSQAPILHHRMTL